MQSNTIRTASGKLIDLINPDPNDIDIESIACGLSKTCRFGGQCEPFYSVAEHSIITAFMADQDGVPAHGVMAVLMHDASEAYLGDVVKPLKIALNEYTAIEERMEKAIGLKFNIDFDKWHDTIKKYDLIALKLEKQKIWPNDAAEWECVSGVEGRPNTNLAFLDHRRVRQAFLQGFHHILGKLPTWN